MHSEETKNEQKKKGLKNNNQGSLSSGSFEANIKLSELGYVGTRP